ncbi:ARF/SAR superfamily, partial [Rozella allomycis CSF55]
DVGGQAKIRPLWRHYFTGTLGLIFVIDSQDKERIEESRQELVKIVSDREMKNCVILIFANKQDLERSMGPTELSEQLQLHKFVGDRKWFVQPCTATTGEGLVEGLKWLADNVFPTRKKKT